MASVQLTVHRVHMDRLPSELVAVAEHRRAVSMGKLDGNRQNRIVSSYGANILKVFIRAMPIVFERHHPDLLAAEHEAIAATGALASVSSSMRGPRL